MESESVRVYPFGLSLSKPLGMTLVLAPFDKLRANGTVGQRRSIEGFRNTRRQRGVLHRSLTRGYRGSGGHHPHRARALPLALHQHLHADALG